jgi:DNA-binding NarL/FixJ family response regulator
MRKIKIAIVDDQELFAGSLKVVLESYGGSEIQVVGIAYNGKDALTMVKATKPNIVLMDIRMPELDGVEATRIIHELYPRIKIVILTTFDDDEYIFGALNNGACGYILKNMQPEELVSSIKSLHDGNLLMAQSVGVRLISHMHHQTGFRSSSEKTAGEINHLISRFPSLSRREAEVLDLIIKKLDNREIAERLFIAEQTVKNYTSKIYAKLDVQDRLHAMKIVDFKG